MLRAGAPTLAIAILAAVASLSGTARAQFGDQVQRQAQCELSAIGTTRSPLALSWIKTACNQLAINTGLLGESNRRFHECLVNNLSGVQLDEAAAQVVSSCRNAYPP